ncbi:MAG TPA: hypothetical protein PKE12_01550 [Kiritimatiellia bacterium]|nr:hypothetical protein [Kiritimatiellia bacterium]
MNSDEPSRSNGSLLKYVLTGFAGILGYGALVALGQDKSRLLRYPMDRAYADLAIAREWATSGLLGAGGERLPAHMDSLWQGLLALAYRGGAQLLATPLIVSLPFALISLWAVLLWARAIQPRPAYLWWTTAAWVLTAPLALDAFSGRSLVLACALAAAAFVIHQRGLRPGATPLPLIAAALVGLALLVRVELAVLWVLFGLHALVLAALRRIDASWQVVLVRWINGFILGAIFLLPVIWWNRQALEVPWPVAPDAATTAIFAGMPGAAESGGAAAAWTALLRGPYLADSLIRLFVLAGAGCLAYDLYRGRVPAAASAVFLGVLAPPVFAVLYPFLGAEALPHIQRALLPAWVLLAGYAVLRGADGLDQLTGRAHLPVPRAYIFIAAIILLGAMPVLAGLRGQVLAHRDLRDARNAAHEARAQVAMKLGPAAQFQGGLVSEQPGWLMFQRYSKVFDLSGRLHPVAINWIYGGALRDSKGFTDYLRGQGIGTAVFWSPAPASIATQFSCPPYPEPGPVVCTLSPNAAP